MALTLGFVYASSNNYPGAQALLKLHELEPKTNRKPDSLVFAYTLYVEKLKKLAVFSVTFDITKSNMVDS